jgi:rsbT co-antagonist protein RsbR
MTKDSTTQVTVDRSRIDRLMDVLSLASIGEFEHERCSITVDREDDFAMLEQTLKIFIQELAAAHRENELHVGELTDSREALEKQLSTIQSQQDAIKRLSTPTLEIWEGILVLPVIGLMDDERASEMTEQLLRRVVESGSRAVIVDVTGAAAFDTSTADHFLRLLKSARLLGAQCVLTGISAENAQALIALEVDFREVMTRRTLKDGLELFTRRRKSQQPAAAKEPKPQNPAPGNP